jgi:hypothetical protein
MVCLVFHTSSQFLTLYLHASHRQTCVDMLQSTTSHPAITLLYQNCFPPNKGAQKCIKMVSLSKGS